MIAWYQRLLASTLEWGGGMPSHVGFIMDGNRRYARQLNQQTMVGHTKGFDQLMYILELCLLLGVQTVTVFAFSLDNFKRSKDEVDGLMNLCREKFSDLQNKSSLLFEKGIRIRIVGDISKLPADLQEIIVDLETKTHLHTNVLFNVCLAYSSMNDLYHCHFVRNSDQFCPSLEQDQQAMMYEKLYDPNNPIEPFKFRCLGDALRGTDGPIYPKPLDLIVRTSGENRLSDFLLEQASGRQGMSDTLGRGRSAQLCFLNCLWPELGYWDLIKVFMNYREFAAQDTLQKS